MSKTLGLLNYIPPPLVQPRRVRGPSPPPPPPPPCDRAASAADASGSDPIPYETPRMNTKEGAGSNYKRTSVVKTGDRSARKCILQSEMRVDGELLSPLDDTACPRPLTRLHCRNQHHIDRVSAEAC
jgi:hypothetical protein